jgi:hypothetical protein
VFQYNYRGVVSVINLIPLIAGIYAASGRIYDSNEVVNDRQLASAYQAAQILCKPAGQFVCFAVNAG